MTTGLGERKLCILTSCCRPREGWVLLSYYHPIYAMWVVPPWPNPVTRPVSVYFKNYKIIRCNSLSFSFFFSFLFFSFLFFFFCLVLFLFCFFLFFLFLCTLWLHLFFKIFFLSVHWTGSGRFGCLWCTTSNPGRQKNWLITLQQQQQQIFFCTYFARCQ